MKQLLLIKDTLSNQISYYHLALMLAVLPFDQFYSHIIFISFALHTLFHLQKDRIKQLATLRTGIMQAIFFVTLISLTYTAYPAKAGDDITRQLTILLFPVFFSLTSFNFRKYRDNLLLIFSIVSAATIVYLYLYALYVIHYFKLPVKVIFSETFINHKFSAPIGIHATFFSMQVVIAFFYIVIRLLKQQNFLTKAVYILTSLILLAGIIQLGSKAIFIVVLLGMLVAVPYFIISARKQMRYVLVSSVITVIVVGGALSINSFKQRYVTGLETDLSKFTDYENVEPRVVRWQAALEVAVKNPIVGYGAGAELPILADKYFEKKMYISFVNRLNAHNQYITFLLTTGIIGLLIYLSTLYFGFEIAFRQRDMLFFIFLLTIVVVSVSESLLHAEKGIYFYSLFFSFFVFSEREKAR
ncbi:O-antigen ligase family protein [Mucilaginibacter boryungensis]|uniref:O-antigen ligase family protein n=1 Tax=Mucilaginibacter boryungensis TaxID=768480 RepID=A0ABR9XGJ8_9SPHI|nr:O-antigen ligase family protein [Mucilaginibacter boryungensis]MBE9666356.1 O-antigen ligase family protein [Mucilaginibacter boryungensis]